MDNLLLTKELDRFYYLWRESIAIYEDWAKQYGLSNNVVMVMESIYNNRENCTPSSISHKWFIPKQTLNSIYKNKVVFLQRTVTKNDFTPGTPNVSEGYGWNGYNGTVAFTSYLSNVPLTDGMNINFNYEYYYYEW